MTYEYMIKMIHTLVNIPYMDDMGQVPLGIWNFLPFPGLIPMGLAQLLCNLSVLRARVAIFLVRISRLGNPGHLLNNEGR